MDTKITKRLTVQEWNALVPQIKDISDELSDSFLVFGQWMRAMIEMDGRKYYVSGWAHGGEQWVDLEQV